MDRRGRLATARAESARFPDKVAGFTDTARTQTTGGASSVGSVGAWVRNATDKLYWTNIVDLQGFGYDYRHRGLPRMYGADVTYHF